MPKSRKGFATVIICLQVHPESAGYINLRLQKYSFSQMFFV